MMGFIRKLAPLSGIGLAASLLKGKDKESKPKQSLVTGDYPSTGSLVNNRSIY